MQTLLWITITLLIVNLLTNLFHALKQSREHEQRLQLEVRFQQELSKTREQLTQQLHSGQIEANKQLSDTLYKTMHDIREQITTSLKQHAVSISQQIGLLTEKTDQRLKEISGLVEKRLAEGFEKTTATFTDIIKRLALIDEAQKKITELSTNVVSLQEILSDKQARGVFGEVQLAALIRNALPEQHFSLQHTLSTGKRADCILFLPEPTGNIVIDAKFPLDSFRPLTNTQLATSERRVAKQQFKQDIRKHIQDIATKYIIPQETSEGAVMFIPAEAVFAEIHSHYPELVEEAHRVHVWLVSPTTMMAILNTARAVIKDSATRKQVHIIQEHLHYLAKDFQRFEKRMDNLSKHINQAQQDVEQVNTSAKKISERFGKIENVELANETSIKKLETSE